MAVAEVSVEEQLAWEKRQRPRAAALALASGLVTIGGLVLAGLASRDQPSALLLDSLRNLEKSGRIGDETTVHVAGACSPTCDFQYASGHGGAVLISIVLLAVGLGGIGLTISFLGRCVRARRPRMPRLAMPAPVVGGSLIGIGVLGVYLAQRGFHSSILDGDRTVDAVRKRPPAEGIFLVVELLGLFVFALGALLTSLNAMRSGLLTRTMGILGMFTGGAIVLFGPTQPLLPLWTAFLAPLFLGRWMGGQPPAWSSGREEPWPTAQQAREQRQQGNLAESDPAPVERAAKPHPSSKKRKRKRRN
jgi:hypothetical protein